MDLTGMPGQIAVAAAIVLLVFLGVERIVKLVKDLQAKKNGDAPKASPVRLDKIESALERLIEWHQPDKTGTPADVDFRAMDNRVKHIDQLLSKVDADGVPMVYTRKSIYDAIDRIVLTLERQATNQELIIRMMERMSIKNTGG